MSTSTTTPTQPTVSTTEIAVNGARYELMGLSLEDGLKIYNGLPANYRTKADAYAAIALNFQRALNIPLPNGMDFKHAFTNYLAAIDNGAKALSSNADGYMKQLDALFGDQIRSAASGAASALPGADTAASAAGAVAGVANFAGGVVNGAAAVPGAIVGGAGLVGSAFTELMGKVTPGITADQAKAFGAALAGAELYEGAVHNAMPMGTLFWNYPLDASIAGFNWAGANIPGVNLVWPYLVASFKWIGSMLGHAPGAKALSFSEALTEANKEIEQYKGKSWQQITNDRLGKGDADRANARVVAAGTIAGVETKERAQAISGDLAYVNKDGMSSAVDTTGPTPVETNLTTPDGKPITAGARLRDQAAGVVGGVANSWNNSDGTGKAGMVLGGVAGGVATIAVGRGFAEGAAQRIVSGMPTRAQDALNAANTERHALLVRRAAAVAGDKPHWWSRGPEDIAKLDKQIKAIDTQLPTLRSNAATIGTTADRISELKQGNLLQRGLGSLAAAGEADLKGGITSAPRLVGRIVGGGTAAAGHSLMVDPARGIRSGIASATDLNVTKSGLPFLEATGFLGRSAQVAANIGTRALKYVAPAVVAGQAIDAVHRNDGTEATIRITEGTAMVGAVAGAARIAGIGMRAAVPRAVPAIGAIWSGGNFISSYSKGDGRGMVTSGTELGFTGVGTAIGGVAGAFGGPFAPATIPAGMALGAGIGNLVGWGASYFTGKMYDNAHPEKTQAATTQMDAAVERQLLDAIKQVRGKVDNRITAAVLGKADASPEAILKALKDGGRLQYLVDNINKEGGSVEAVADAVGRQLLATKNMTKQQFEGFSEQQMQAMLSRAQSQAAPVFRNSKSAIGAAVQPQSGEQPHSGVLASLGVNQYLPQSLQNLF